MSHEFESGMSVRLPMWHGLGNVLDEYPEDAADALIQSGLNWSVRKVPLFADVGGEIEETRFTQVIDYMGVVRSTDHSVLGVVSPKYEPIQNRRMMEFIWDLMSQSEECMMETAGSLKSGKIVWALAKLNEYDLVDDEHELTKDYILITNSHDGSNALRVLMTSVRVVCWNTWSAAISGATNTWAVRHIGFANERIEECRKSIGMAVEWSENSKEAMEYLADQRCDSELFNDLLSQVWPFDEDEDEDSVIEIMEKRQTELNDLYLGINETSSSIAGTNYAAFQAVNEQLDYLTTARGDSDVEKNERRFIRTFVDQKYLGQKSTALAMLLGG